MKALGWSFWAGALLLSTGYLTGSGDIFDSHNSEIAPGIRWAEVRGAPKQPTVYRTVPHQRLIRPPVSGVLRLGYPAIDKEELVLWMNGKFSVLKLIYVIEGITALNLTAQ